MSEIADVAWIGIDVGKTAHHAVAIDSEGKTLWSKEIRNDQAAIDQLLTRVAITAHQSRWAVDLTSSGAALLLALLVAADQRVVYVPGRVVNRMGGAFVGEGKTDAKDAQVIAETARLRRDLCELSTPNELIVELALLDGPSR